MPSRNVITWTIWATALLLWGYLAFGGTAAPDGWFHFVSGIVTFVLALFGLFENWLWRSPPISWIVKRPDLQGTWKTEIRSGIPPFKAYAVIRQTYSTIRMKLYARDSKSDSLVAALDYQDDEWRLVTVYRNTPRANVVAQSRPHVGGVILTLSEHPTLTLEGHYWTDRDTRGEMTLTEPRRKLFSSFASADAERAGDAVHKQ